ncbi:copper homeostasis protein CutC [Thalassospira marina]|uniref:PF03932 family protein CutC n=2 Tax=Thalassospira marina TaxID=2048283 RepID=A0A2N3KUI1_9PROT|nr:copper homeostasis protein CutC [Thalassospira marina]
MTLEVCVESFEDALIAAQNGADRIEYCSALAVGGLTPTPGALARMPEIPVPCFAMIRPRPGNFVYSATEIETMTREIAMARQAGAQGVVFGACKADGSLDTEALKLLCDAAGGLAKTLHRAFDVTPDAFGALETAVSLGFDRILTSGQKPTAEEGCNMIADLIARAQGRIIILPGSGVTAANASTLRAKTGTSQLHASCKQAAAKGEEGRVATDGRAVRDLRRAMDH